MLDCKFEDTDAEESLKKLKDLTEALLKIAEKDLEAAKVLYSHKLYPHAVFYAEQCAEKTAKATLILCLQRKIQVALLREEFQSTDSEGDSERDARCEDVVKKLVDVGHNVIELARELCSCIKTVSSSISRYLLILKDNPKPVLEGTRLKALQNLAETFKKQNEEIEKICEPITKCQPQSLLELSRNEEKLLEYFSKLEGIYEDFAKIRPFVLTLIDLMNIVVPTKTCVMGDLLQDVFTGVTGVMHLGLLIVLSPHVTRSRYPEIGFSPIDEYTENHPLIKHFDKILRLFEDAFKA